MYHLLGTHLSGSFSKIIHQHLGVYKYNLTSLSEKDFDDFMISKNFKGLNITMPYKKKALKYCNSLSENAKLCGNVNTVIKDNNSNLLGYNTDFFGLKYGLEYANIQVKNETCLILGHGGSGSTAIKVLQSMDAKKIIVASRRNILPEFKGANTINYKDISSKQNNSFINDISLVVNATPLGKGEFANIIPIDLKILPNCKSVFDLNYGKKNTPLLNEGLKLHLNISDGLSMLVAQALKSADLFTSQKYNFVNQIPENINYLKDYLQKSSSTEI